MRFHSRANFEKNGQTSINSQTTSELEPCHVILIDCVVR